MATSVNLMWTIRKRLKNNRMFGGEQLYLLQQTLIGFENVFTEQNLQEQMESSWYKTVVAPENTFGKTKKVIEFRRVC